MADLCAEYLGTLNVELTNYFRELRPRYRTAMLSNSFVGARRGSTSSTASPTSPTSSSTPTRWG